MPQFRPKPTLERSASADLARKTLSRIPTSIGRIVYLASLRDPNSGTYHHHGLASIFGPAESRGALLEGHEAAFREWLELSLVEKHEDLSSYLNALEDPRDLVLDNWRNLGVYRSYIPASACESDRELFFAEFNVLLAAFRCEDSGASPRS